MFLSNLRLYSQRTESKIYSLPIYFMFLFELLLFGHRHIILYIQQIDLYTAFNTSQLYQKRLEIMVIWTGIKNSALLCGSGKELHIIVCW